ncbi:MAG: hypothetical protein AB9891_01720 [Anaerolineaceae bacterium]
MNSIPPEQISARALDFLERLVTEIGPRPAGSPAEKQAQEMIGRILTDKGLRLLWMDVPFSRQSPFLFHNFLAGVGLLAAVETLASGFPWVSLLMPLLIGAAPELIWLIKRTAPPGAKSSSNLPGSAGKHGA